MQPCDCADKSGDLKREEVSPSAGILCRSQGGDSVFPSILPGKGDGPGQRRRRLFRCDRSDTGTERPWLWKGSAVGAEYGI